MIRCRECRYWSPRSAEDQVHGRCYVKLPPWLELPDSPRQVAAYDSCDLVKRHDFGEIAT